jgi:hypothetical protein
VTVDGNRRVLTIVRDRREAGVLPSPLRPRTTDPRDLWRLRPRSEAVARRYGFSPSLLFTWKRRMLERAPTGGCRLGPLLRRR